MCPGVKSRYSSCSRERRKTSKTNLMMEHCLFRFATKVSLDRQCGCRTFAWNNRLMPVSRTSRRNNHGTINKGSCSLLLCSD